MPIDDDRRVLFDALEASMGARAASLLMAHLPPAGWADLATRADLGAQGVALRGDMAELRGELKGEMAELRGELAELRGELRAMLPRVIAANIASMIGVAGLVLGAVSVGT